MTADGISRLSICIHFILLGKEITGLVDTTVRETAASFHLCLIDNTLLVPRSAGSLLQYELTYCYGVMREDCTNQSACDLSSTESLVTHV